MEIDIQLVNGTIPHRQYPPSLAGSVGAWAEFCGIVRREENGSAIAALEYEAYAPMAERELRRILEEIARRQPCQFVQIIHRLGVVPVGEMAIYFGITARHRREAFAMLTDFMERLKQDVPIWKQRAI